MTVVGDHEVPLLPRLEQGRTLLLEPTLLVQHLLQQLLLDSLSLTVRGCLVAH
jgi:hypothetical protein